MSVARGDLLLKVRDIGKGMQSAEGGQRPARHALAGGVVGRYAGDPLHR